jgi:cystathionine gamma-synthase
MSDSGTPSVRLRQATRLVASGRRHGAGAPMNPPLVPASSFLMGAERGYTRNDGNPTWEALEDLLGDLESGSAICFASGMAAVAAVFDRLPVGASVVLPKDCYQGVTALATAGVRRGRWSLQRLAVEETDAWVEACASADLVWLESPSNPLLTVADLEPICAAARKPGAMVVVDNTFATPLNQRPLDLGATISLQSVTKFIGGHSDLLSGVLVTRHAELAAALRQSRALNGATPGVLESYLALRGARTLALRLERAQQSAMVLAERLTRHPQVECVRYPGLASHPTHAVASRVLAGFGTMIAFDTGGGAAGADRVCAAVRLIRHATSLGGVESSMERRAALSGQEHLPASLLRLSVGIEDVDDLWDDLDAALRTVTVDGS